MWIIILVLAVLVIYLFTQQRKTTPSGSAAGETAMEILKKRLARGEISREEYDSLKKDLQ